MKGDKPTVGRIVHYVLSGLDGSIGDQPGQHRPAIIVNVTPDGLVNLQLFTDGIEDRGQSENVVWVPAVAQDEDARQCRTWHWPEEED